MINRGVNRAEISGPARKYFCSSRPGINILQNLYNGLNTNMLGGTHKNLLSTGIICDLISVLYNRRLVKSSKQNIIFIILGNLKNNKKN